MVLQGRRLEAGRAGRRSLEPGLRARRRRGAGDRRRLRDRRRTARRCASASRSATSSPTTSWSGRTSSVSPIRSCARRASGRSCWSAICRPTCTASRASGAEAVVWERPFLSGEQNMSHAIANLEAHHFKYELFRRPGDVHVHYFGTATLSFTDGIETREGRRVRDRGRTLRPAVAQPALGGQGREGRGEGALDPHARSSPGRFRWRGGLRWFRPRTARRR